VPSTPPHSNGNRIRIGSATAGFVAVVAVLGAVTRIFGLEAGLLALVLSVVALVVLPQVFGGSARHGSSAGLPTESSTESSESPLDAGDDGDTDRSSA
jgi:hypothetical protein